MHVRVHVHVGVWVCGVCVWMCVCVISDQIMGQGLVQLPCSGGQL